MLTFLQNLFRKKSSEKPCAPLHFTEAEKPYVARSAAYRPRAARIYPSTVDALSVAAVVVEDVVDSVISDSVDTFLATEAVAEFVSGMAESIGDVMSSIGDSLSDINFDL